MGKVRTSIRIDERVYKLAKMLDYSFSQIFEFGAPLVALYGPKVKLEEALERASQLPVDVPGIVWNRLGNRKQVKEFLDVLLAQLAQSGALEKLLDQYVASKESQAKQEVEEKA